MLPFLHEDRRFAGRGALRPRDHGGTPVFVGTRVPLQNLIDYLEGGESIEDFLDGFPSVKRDQVIAVIEAAKFKMLETV
ncbi:MAG: DUF433 domain-containing protein [Nitrosomonadaceae bacterium]|nr:DUF433 domain-containing protein [Nitrosomonadaceae bacterium]